jgi:cytochrome c-type biogenesis protein CcmF
MGAPFAVEGCGYVGEQVAKGSEPRNFNADLGRFRLVKDGEHVATLCPEKRQYPVAQMPTTEAAIHTTLLRDVYVTLGDRQQDGDAWAVRSYWKPLVSWIWLGPLVMSIGGVVSLTDRRFRVGAAAKRPGRSRPASTVPAE